MTIGQTKTRAFFLGSFSSVAQVILIREFMSAFGGNELMLIFLMAGWLVGVAVGAGRICGFLHHNSRKSPDLFLIAGLLLLVSFIGARLIRLWLGIPPGQIVDAVFAGGLSALFAFPVSMVYGAIFTALSRDCDQGKDSGEVKIGGLYAIEALGFVFGGIFLTGLFWMSVDVVCIVFVLSFWHWVLAAWGFGQRRLVFILAVAGLMLWVLRVPTEGGRILSKMPWPGFEVLASRDSVFGRVTVVKRLDQVSLFENGVLAYSAGDQMTSEESVHYALLAHALPKKILLISGGPGVVAEALKYPGAQVDYVEMDSLAIDLTRRFFPGAEKTFIGSRVCILTGDGRRVVKAAHGQYDAILVNVSDPITILINRYYTREFFQETALALKNGGVLSLAVSSSENYMNEENQAFLRMIATTLRSVFSDVKVIPGDRVIFLASPSHEALKVDIESLFTRLKERRISTKYVQPYYFADRLSALRMSQITDLLATPQQINTDARPYGLMRALVFWSTHFGSTFARLMRFCDNPVVLLLIASFSGFLLIAGSFIPSLGIPATTMLVLGFTQMVTQSVILLYFQSMYGYLFGWMGLLTAAFMWGVFLGGRGIVNPSHAARALRVTQGVAILLFLFLAAVLGGWLEGVPRWAGMSMLFLAAVMVGMIGGRIFSLAGSQRKSAEGLYSLDVLGAAVGALLGGVILIPVLGVQMSLIVCAGAGLVIWVIAFIRQDGLPVRRNALP